MVAVAGAGLVGMLIWLMRIDRVLVAVCAGELPSVARTVKLKVPLVVGVPLIVAPDRLSPGGRLPPTIAQVTVPEPPLDTSDWL